MARNKKKSAIQKKRDYSRGGKKIKNEIKAGKKQEKIADVMQEFKEGSLRSGSKKGPRVKSRKQAMAIALSEARKKNKKSKRK